MSNIIKHIPLLYGGMIICALHTFQAVQAQEVFFFRDANNPGYYDSGLAFKSSPSIIEQSGPSGDKIPTATFAFQGNNSLRLRWTSKSGGDWSALVIAPGFPFQNITIADTLSFQAYAPDGLSKSHWPMLFMEGAPGVTKSRKYPLGDYAGDLPAKVWTEVKVPLSVFFKDPFQTGIQFNQIKAIIFGQGVADGQEHTLLVDEVRAYKGGAVSGPLLPPARVHAFGYERHIEIQWNLPEVRPTAWALYRSDNDGVTFSLLKNLSGSDSIYIDFPASAQPGRFTYVVRARNSGGQESAPSPVVSAALVPMGDTAFLEMVQRYTFRYFWDFAHPVSGMARERNTSGNLVTIGGSGFGVMALLSGIHRGFITRKEGAERLLKILAFLEKADRFKGAFPHWMDGTTGKVIPFSSKDDGGDIVETAFLFQGLIAARQFFSDQTAEESAIRNKINALWQAVDWNWYRQGKNVVYWHWSPNNQFAINLPVRGWNETKIVYLLGYASPTFPLPPGLWDSGWANNGAFRNGASYYGFRLPLGGVGGGPLFFTHYSFLGFDPRNKKDQYANYFEQNRNQTLINRAYCILNPRQFPGYGPNCWGLTASDDPLVGYMAHEPTSGGDNGTIAPTAAISSMPYTPGESLAALKHFYREFGSRLWGPMGFYDAFNLKENWFANSYLAIDQGPILVMIENYRSGLLWDLFMQAPEIQLALEKTGFTVATALNEPEYLQPDYFGLHLSPNPARFQGWIEFNLNRSETVQIDLYDLNGQLRPSPGLLGNLPEGRHRVPLSLQGLSPGAYVLRLNAGNHYTSTVIVIQP
jgi:hypothetical protein